jgi:hypothetical protein
VVLDSQLQESSYAFAMGSYAPAMLLQMVEQIVKLGYQTERFG